MESVLNLKRRLDLLPQYIELRNCYCELLLTHSIEISATSQWIKNTTTEIRVIEEDNNILGVLLLYLDRDGEVAFLAKQQNRGIGTRLLNIADEIANEAKLSLIWAWVREDNIVAAKVFEKCGYVMSGREKRIYNGQHIRGIRYTKGFAEKAIT